MDELDVDGKLDELDVDGKLRSPQGAGTGETLGQYRFHLLKALKRESRTGTTCAQTTVQKKLQLRHVAFSSYLDRGDTHPEKAARDRQAELLQTRFGRQRLPNTRTAAVIYCTSFK